MNSAENMKNDIRTFVSEWYEKYAPDSTHTNIINSCRGFQIPNGSKLSAPSDRIKHMKHDRSWAPADLELPILALEQHVDFITNTNGIESTLVNNNRRNLIHDFHVLCVWDVNYAFLLCASPGVNL